MMSSSNGKGTNASKQQQHQQQTPRSRPRRRSSPTGSSPSSGGATTSNISSSSSQGYRLLVELAEGCSKHEASCHRRRRRRRRRRKSSSDHPPGTCKVVLDTLLTLFPKTETVHQPNDVVHLCEFYRSVIQGGFCPHAPYLLHHGRQGTQIIPRVHRLVQHLLTKPFWNYQQQQHDVMEDIHVTIAQMLSIIPEPHLQALVWQDLAGMAADLCALFETNNNNTTDEATSSSSWWWWWWGSHDDNNNNNNHNTKIQIAWLEATVQASTGLHDEYLLDVASPLAARLLQASILHIMHHLMMTVNNNNANDIINSANSNNFRGNNKNNNSMTSNDQEQHRDLICGLQSVLWMTTTTTATSSLAGGELCQQRHQQDPNGSRNSKRKKTANSMALHLPQQHSDDAIHNNNTLLLMRCKSWAAVLLKNLVVEAHATPISEARMRELTRIVARAIQHYCDSDSRGAGRNDENGHHDDESDAHAHSAAASSSLATCTTFKSHLADCLQMLVLDSPVVQGLSWQQGHTLAVMEALPSLADSLEWFPSSSLLSTTADEDWHLESAILECLLQGLKLKPRMAFTHEATSKLVRQTAHPVLANMALDVTLVILMWQTKHRDLEQICDHAAAAHRDDLSSSSSLKTPTSGSKRTRSSLAGASSSKSRKRKLMRTEAGKQVSKHITNGAGYFTIVEEIVQMLVRARDSSSCLSSLKAKDLKEGAASGVEEMKIAMSVITVASTMELLVRTAPSDHSDPKETRAYHCLMGLAPGMNLFIQCCMSQEALSQSFRKVAMHVTRTCARINGHLDSCLLPAITPTLYRAANLFKKLMTRCRASSSSSSNVSTLQWLREANAALVIRGAASERRPVLAVDFLGPIAPEETDAQRMRLGWLRSLCGQSPSMMETDDTLNRITLEYIMDTNTNLDHPDPVVRLLLWQVSFWFFVATPMRELQKLLFTSHSVEDSPGFHVVRWLIKSSFNDSDQVVREYCSSKLGGFFGSLENTGAFGALADDDKQWASLSARNRFDLVAPEQASSDIAASEVVSARLFNVVDEVILQGSGDHDASEKVDLPLFCRSSARALLSICRSMDISSLIGKSTYPSVVIRVIRMFSSHSFDGDLELTGCCFQELSIFAKESEHEILVPEKFLEHVIPVITRDALDSSMPSDAGVQVPPLTIESQFRSFEGLLALIMPKSEKIRIVQLSSFYDHCLPDIIAQLVFEKNYPALQAACGFKLFLLAHKKRYEAANTRTDSRMFVNDGSGSHAMLSSGVFLGARTFKSTSWIKRLGDQTRDVCLAPLFVERILPMVFLHAGREELLFFVKTVLQNKMTLRTILISREQLVLKGLVLGLTRENIMPSTATRALRTAAIVRNTESCKQTNARQGGSSSVDDADGEAEATGWVSSHFMYLLVNAVQHRWAIRTTEQKIHSMRCLGFMLTFLRSEESLKHVSQIMASVNAAIATPLMQNNANEEHSALRLRYVAVNVLSSLVKLVAQVSVTALGTNLTAFVVALIPVLDASELKCERPFQAGINETSSAAVSILQWLVSGAIGKQLAPFFEDIPFLPPYPVLDPVRAALKEFGVDFDNLDVAGTQNTSQIRCSLPSDTNSVGGDSANTMTDVRRRLALGRRLEMLCPLLVDENASVRKAVLDHLTSLLRGNRELFHALVESEASTSMKRYVTVANESLQGALRGTITEIVDTLLARCVHETDNEALTLLARCFGEVGALGSHLLEDSKPPSSDSSLDTYTWRIEQPPWRSRPARYQLQLVTKDLVIALKTAQTSAEQHKIVYTIQQLLVLLDEHAPKNDSNASDSPRKPQMSVWLSSKLKEAHVLDTVGPFWFSEFQEENQFNAKSPPFFLKADSYYTWLSNWCRYMIQSSQSLKSQWSQLFFACRTALRSRAGIRVSEFLLPLLILDRICFGSGEDKAIVLREFHDAMTFDASRGPAMSIAERQKAVNVLFVVIDTFTYWSENEVEKKHCRSSRTARGDPERPSAVLGGNWPVDDSILGIEDIVKAVPLVLQARAAASVGMFARSLRLLEAASRSSITEAMYNISTEARDISGNRTSAGTCPATELDLMKDVLAALGNYETVAVMSGRSGVGPKVRVFDNIRLKEASGDWEGALQDYERAYQIESPQGKQAQLQRGTLHCLLELGQLESTLNQVKGYMQSTEVFDHARSVPFAVEAAWRLGRWEELSGLVSSPAPTSPPDDMYTLHLGRVMLSLHESDPAQADNFIHKARSAVMESLGSTGRESYSRAYKHVVNLQVLNEIEDCIPVICDTAAPSPLFNDMSVISHLWEKKLNLMSPVGAPTVMNSRLALSRLAGDQVLESTLFVNAGQRARQSHAFNLAQNAFAQAHLSIDSVTKCTRISSLRNRLHLEQAKLKYGTGDSTEALRMLGQNNLESLLDFEDSERRRAVISKAVLLAQPCETVDSNAIQDVQETELIEFFVETAMQSTQWMVEGGLKGAGEIMSRFRTINKIAPEFEKGHFQFAKYVESVLQSRIAALKKLGQSALIGLDEDSQMHTVISKDSTCQKYILMVMQHYVKALCLDSRHIYQALPRLLSLWFEFTAIDTHVAPENDKEESETLARLNKSQEDANCLMIQHYKNVPAQAFYTAMPQLISRVNHDDKNTVAAVKGILKRVLLKFPSQSLWSLAWLLNSKAPERKRVGEAIFKEAQKMLQKSTHQAHFKMLIAAKSLFRFFHDLAKYTVKDHSTQTVNIKPWKGEVELSEFLPPILAAVAISPDSTDGGFPKDPFARQVPRMRAFAQRVTVMSSKARPKKIKAFVVLADSRLNDRKAKDTRSNDIGELHFLVKQEAKGDLRKDARVQDLNNVINRVMSSSGQGSSAGKRLNLRTFVVTCLSEDTGILEWVPNTTALRSLITKAYNPQASNFSPRRRGPRLVQLTDPTLRNIFEKKCQSLYFNQGSLKKAAALFEKLLLEAYPPLLYWWFVQKYHDPHSWYEARMRFTLSAAAWSAVGHVIGLGDRHSENILVDTESGACVHVDFDCIFDKGLYLPRPEVVPFRLTANMIDAFGPTGADGVFREGLKSAMTVLRGNRDTLLSVLEPFIKDPVIDWRRYRSHQRSSKAPPSAKSDAAAPPSTQDRRTRESKRFIGVIDERLQGIYNLRNPNLKKIRRTDGYVDEKDDELTHLLPLSVDGQVHKLIDEATSSDNLVQLYVGWMPWV